VLADDRDLIREAARHGLTCLRTADLVVRMKVRGLISAVRPVLDRMGQRGYGIAPDLYERSLRAAGEWPGP
jgi:predicted nucleic acid-binding protein